MNARGAMVPLSAGFWDMWIYKARRAEKRERGAEAAAGVGGCDTAFGGGESWGDFGSGLRRAVVPDDVGGCVDATCDSKTLWRDAYGSVCWMTRSRKGAQK